MDERKSWTRLILAYSGAGIVVLVAAFFIARAASHNNFIVAHSGSTPPPSEVGVYSGIAPDATASPAPTDTPSPTPSASASASPTPSAKATPLENPEAVAAAAAAALHKHAAKHPHRLLADTGSSSDGAPADSGEASHIVPIVHPSDRPAGEPAPEAIATPTAVPTAAPIVATPAPVATAAPAANVPIFAPERIVDAQVKVAVQPDMSAADRERGAHGTSVVLVTIDPKGNVVNAVVGTSSGYPTLDRAAVTAARSSQFVAPKINGHPATETYRVVYEFDQ